MADNESPRRGIPSAKHSPSFLLEFDTADDLFYRGFQCGEIWACLVDGVKEVQAIVSADNAEMVMRMTEATGYSFVGRYLTEQEMTDIDTGPGEWMAVLMRCPDDK
jgi:hypothetical protein